MTPYMQTVLEKDKKKKKKKKNKRMNEEMDLTFGNTFSSFQAERGSSSSLL